MPKTSKYNPSAPKVRTAGLGKTLYDKYKTSTGKSQTPAQKRYQLKRTLPKGRAQQAFKKTHVNSFPGRIKNSENYPDGTVGRFVQSVKGHKGIDFVDKAIKQTLAEANNLE